MSQYEYQFLVALSGLVIGVLTNKYLQKREDGGKQEYLLSCEMPKATSTTGKFPPNKWLEII